MAEDAADQRWINFGPLIVVPLCLWWRIAGIPQPKDDQGAPSPPDSS
jgi:hypothetical protein